MKFNYWDTVLGKKELKKGTLLLTYDNILYEFTKIKMNGYPKRIYGINLFEEDNKEEIIPNLKIKEQFNSYEEYEKYYDKELNREINIIEYFFGKDKDIECEQMFIKQSNRRVKEIKDIMYDGYYNVFIIDKKKYVVMGRKIIEVK